MKDDEVMGSGNAISFKYRVHDARVGSFFSVDPLEAKYPWNSTYAFSENRVLHGIELEGKEFTPLFGVNEMITVGRPTIGRLGPVAFGTYELGMTFNRARLIKMGSDLLRIVRTAAEDGLEIGVELYRQKPFLFEELKPENSPEPQQSASQKSNHSQELTPLADPNPQSKDHSNESTEQKSKNLVTVYKAPRTADQAERWEKYGLSPDDFPGDSHGSWQHDPDWHPDMGKDKRAYVTDDPNAAKFYAEGYGHGVLVMKLPRNVWKMVSGPRKFDQASQSTEYGIRSHLLPVFNAGTVMRFLQEND